jgi:hypothetical protein
MPRQAEKEEIAGVTWADQPECVVTTYGVAVRVQARTMGYRVCTAPLLASSSAYRSA